MRNALPYGDLEGVPDEDLEWFIRTDLGVEPDQCFFKKCRVALAELAQFVTSPLEDYLLDGNETAYVRAVAIADCYEEGGDEALPPIVGWRNAEGWHMLDGFKRCAGANHAGLADLPAYEVVRAGGAEPSWAHERMS